MVHERQRVHAGLDADAVGRGDEDAVGGQAHLVGARDDPLGVGGGEMGGEQEHARAEMRGVGHLAGCVFGAELGGMRALAQLGDPLRTAGQQAPVVGDADRVDGVDVRAGLGVEIDEAALVVGAGNDSGDAHVKVGVGLGLGVHAGIAVDEAGDEEFSRAVDDAGALGDGDGAGQADVGNAAVADDDDGIGNVARGVAPVGDVDHRATDENQWNGGRGGLELVARPERSPRPIRTSTLEIHDPVAWQNQSDVDCRTRNSAASRIIFG